MTFPTTALVDSFTRADADPIGTNWTELVDADAGLKIISNQLAGIGANYNAAYWDAATFSGDVEMYATIATKGASAQTLSLAILVDVAGGTVDGFHLDVLAAAGTDTVVLYRVTANAYTQIGSTVTAEFANGDAFGLERIGGVINVYKKPAAGAWGSILSVADANHTGAARLVVWMQGTTWRVDDVGGGTVIPAAPSVMSRMSLMGVG